MSQLRSALDEMFAIDDADLTPEELVADVVELSHIVQMGEVLRTRRVRRLNDSGGHHSLGYSSATALLTDQTGMSPGRARQVVSMGAAAEKAPTSTTQPTGQTAARPPSPTANSSADPATPKNTSESG